MEKVSNNSSARAGLEIEITDCTVISQNGEFKAKIEFNREVFDGEIDEDLEKEIYWNVFDSMPERFKGTSDEDGYHFYEEIEDRENEMLDDWEMSKPQIAYPSKELSLNIVCVETFPDEDEE